MYVIQRAKPKQSPRSNAIHQLPLSPSYRYNLFRDSTAANIAEEGYKRNSLVFELVTRRAVAVRQAEVYLVDVNNPDVPVTDAPLLDLLRRPSPISDEKRMMSTLEIYGCIGGDRFEHKVRDAYGQIIQTYAYHASQMQPIQGNTNWIEYYRYDNGTGTIVDIPTVDIIQYMWDSIDFQRPWKSIPPLVAGAKEIDIDNDRALMEIALLQNGAVPAFLLELSENAMVENEMGQMVMPTQQQLDRLAERMQERFGTRNRGKGGIVPPGTKIHPLGFSPKDMSTNIFSEMPETRLCDLLGIPLQITSLRAAQSAKTYSNYGEAQKAFYEDTMVSAWDTYGAVRSHAYANEMFYGDNKKYLVKYDYSKVRALQESQNEIQERSRKDYMAGIITKNEARLSTGYEEVEGGEVFNDAPRFDAQDQTELNQKEARDLAQYVNGTGRGKVHKN